MPRFSLCTVCNSDRAQFTIEPCGHRIHAACSAIWPLVNCPHCESKSCGISLLEDEKNIDSRFCSSMRNGRWTLEEERYSEALIDEFTTGRLPILRGSKLAHFLADVLGRTPAGIRRKFIGCKSILYGGFQNITDSFLKSALISGQKNFRELESFFLISLSCQSSSPKAFEDLNRFFFCEWQKKFIDFCNENGQKIVCAKFSNVSSKVISPTVNLVCPPNKSSANQYSLSSTARNPPIPVQSNTHTVVPHYQKNVIALSSPERSEYSQESTSGKRSLSSSHLVEDPKWKKRFDDNIYGTSIPGSKFSMPEMRRFASPKIHVYAKKDELLIQEAWLNQHQLLSREQQIAFDKSLFDQACNFIYSYKNMKVINPSFEEDSIIPVICKLLSACSKETTIWFMSLKNDYKICFLSDGIEAMGIKREDLIGAHVFSNKIMKVLFHALDKNSYFQMFQECQNNIRKLVEEATLSGTGMAPFHANIDKWLNNTTTMRYRHNPLKNGWADLVINGYKPPDKEYNGYEQVRCFCTDKFWICMDIQLRAPPVDEDIQPNNPVLSPLFLNPNHGQMPTSGTIPLTFSTSVISPTDSPSQADITESFHDTDISSNLLKMTSEHYDSLYGTNLSYQGMSSPQFGNPLQPEDSNLEDDPELWNMLSGFFNRDESSIFS